MGNGAGAAFDEQFWSELEPQLCEQIASIDRRINELYAERDKITAFLRDHGRRCA